MKLYPTLPYPMSIRGFIVSLLEMFVSLVLFASGSTDIPASLTEAVSVRGFKFRGQTVSTLNCNASKLQN